MMEALAELYWEQGKFAESSRVYRKVISMNMDSPRICEWQNKVVRNTLSQGSKRDQVQEIQRLGAVYDRVADMKGVKKDQIEECKTAFHDTSKELALIWHKEAQKTKNPDTYVLGDAGLQGLPRALPRRQGVLRDGVLLRRDPVDRRRAGQGRWKDAAEQYTKVVELNPKGKYVKEAAYAAVLAWKNALNVDDHEQKEAVEKDRQAFNNKKGGKLEALTIPEYQKKMIDAFETYVKYVPDAPERVVIMYREARIYYEYNHFDDAAKRFEVIVDKYPKHELAIYSANLLLDSLNAQGKTKEVVSYVDKFLEMPRPHEGPRVRQADDLAQERHLRHRGPRVREAAQLQGVRALVPGRGRGACRITRSTPSAAGTRRSASRTRTWSARRCKARVALIQEHPKDPLAQSALFRVAAGYHQLAYYSKAAESYEEFANKFPGEKKATDALGNATTFRIGLGESSKALDDMESFVKFYGTRKPQDAAGVFFQMADVYERDKKYDELAKHLESYLKKWGPQGGPDRQVLAHFRLGELAWKASCPKANEDGACLEIKRIAATGRQKVLDDLNKKLKKGKKVCTRRSARSAARPPARRSCSSTAARRQAAKAAGALPGRAQDLEQGRGRLEDHRQGRRGARRLGAVRGRGLGASTSPRRRTRTSCASSSPRASTSSSRASTTTSARPRRRRRRPRSRARSSAPTSTRRPRGSTRRARMYLDVFGMKQAQWTIASSARVGQLYSRLRRPALHRRDPQGPQGAGRVGQPPARDLLRRAE